MSSATGLPANDLQEACDRAVAQFQSGEKQQGLEMMQGLVKAHPQDSRVHRGLGDMFTSAEDYAGEEKSYRKAIAIADEAESYQGLWLALLKQGKVKELNEIAPRLMKLKNENEAVAVILLGLAEKSHDQEMFFEVLTGLKPDFIKNPTNNALIMKVAYRLANDHS